MSGTQVKWTKVEFDGTAKSFPKYEVQLKAALGIEGWTKVLDEKFKQELPASEHDVLDETKPDEKKRIEARELNAKVVNMIVLGQKSVTMINMIETTKSADWPSGLACEIWSEFRGRFAPEDDIAEMDMEDELAKIRITAKEDPWKVVDKIAVGQIKYSKAISEVRKVAIIIRAGKSHYAQVITATSQLIRRTENRPATSRELLNEMRTQWRIENRGGANEDDTPTEATLASQSKSKFDGVCYNCGEKGHKAKDCPNPKSGNGGGNNKAKFNGNCNFCGRKGHKEADCWDKPENAHKRPKKWKPREQRSEAVVCEVLMPQVEKLRSGDQVPYEFLLTSINTTPENQKDESCARQVVSHEKEKLPNTRPLWSGVRQEVSRRDIVTHNVNLWRVCNELVERNEKTQR